MLVDVHFDTQHCGIIIVVIFFVNLYDSIIGLPIRNHAEVGNMLLIQYDSIFIDTVSNLHQG
jgi:hypothetical protein